jgi:hypothetical protein
MITWYVPGEEMCNAEDFLRLGREKVGDVDIRFLKALLGSEKMSSRNEPIDLIFVFCQVINSKKINVERAED